MKDFTTQNTNSRVVINCAPTDEVKRLKQTIVKEIQKSPLSLNLKGGMNALDQEIDLSGSLEFIKNVLLGIDCSDEFDEAIYACLRHCTYRTTEQITKDLFDRCPEAREDYYEIIFACIEENLRPFLKSLVSTLKMRFQNSTLLQKLGSENE